MYCGHGQGRAGLRLRWLFEEQPTDKMPKMNGLKMIETAIKDQQFYSLVLTSYSD